MAIVKKATYTYTGEVNSVGQPHGRGKVEFVNGEVCHGTFKNGKREGDCTLYFAKDNERFSYEGEYANDKFDGYGTLTYRNGDRFSGSFKEGKPHGWGTYFKRVGPGREETHYGQYHMGLKFGKFTKTDPYGSQSVYYENEWKDDTAPAQKPAPAFNAATLLKTYEQAKADAAVYAKKLNPCDRKAAGIDGGDRYEGEKSLTGKPHGKGVYRYANGDVYSGEFSFGNISGKGKYVDKSGAYFDGEFIDGVKVGEGYYSSLEYGGTPRKYQHYIFVKGKWRSGVITSGEIKYKKYGDEYFEMEKYEGEIAPGTYFPHGRGRYTEKDGSYYEGEFYMGKRQGYGKYYSRKDGSTYSGDWYDGKRHGLGSLTYPYESDYYGYKNKYGMWENDVFKS